MNINNPPKPKLEEFVGGFRLTVFKTPQKTNQKMTLGVKFVSEIV